MSVVALQQAAAPCLLCLVESVGVALTANCGGLRFLCVFFDIVWLARVGLSKVLTELDQSRYQIQIKASWCWGIPWLPALRTPHPTLTQPRSFPGTLSSCSPRSNSLCWARCAPSSLCSSLLLTHSASSCPSPLPLYLW